MVSVRKELRGPQVVVSRTHPGLVERLFKLEVPEIASGIVEIKAVAREAGHRSKIAVVSHHADVSAKGACIGPMGQRVRAVMHELNEEKIDIIDWSPDPARFVGHALSPAKVTSVTVVDETAPGRPGGGAGLPAVPGHRPGGSERPPGRPADRLADRHPLRHGSRSRPTEVTGARRIGPVRMCAGCRGRAGKAELIRIVARDGVGVVDEAQTAPGRGVYLHPRPRVSGAGREAT